MEYAAHIVMLVAVYATLSVSLELLVGRTGLLSVAHAAFYGIGAYASGVLTVRYGYAFPSAMGIGVLIAVAASLSVSVPSVRLHDDYFVIATLGLQVIALSVFNNWMQVTRGPLGIAGISPPVLMGWHADTYAEFLLLATIALGLACVLVWRVTNSPFGRVLLAIREDEVLAKAFGKNPLWFKVAACAIGAAIASVAGSLYAHFVSYIDPSSFTIGESVLVLSMVIMGGLGTITGPVAGAAVLVALPEALRFLGFSPLIAANLRQVLYGLALVVLMMVRPRGLVGRYGLDR